MQKVCVFCGSNPGGELAYSEAAVNVGRLIASRGGRLVYGGGRVGLMGSVANAALEAGGEVIGVMPRSLVEKEIAHNGLTKLHIVESMHERKALMEKLSDAFLLLPGGFGSWDEFSEIVTWAQLGIHAKPCGILNVAGYYDPFLAQIDRAVAEGFVRPAHRNIVLVASDAGTLLSRLMSAGIGEGKTRAEHREWSDQLYATYARGVEARMMASILGEAQLPPSDARALAFADQFERELVGQGRARRTLDETFAVGWSLLEALPRAELQRVSDRTWERRRAATTTS